VPSEQSSIQSQRLAIRQRLRSGVASWARTFMATRYVHPPCAVAFDERGAKRRSRCDANFASLEAGIPLLPGDPLAVSAGRSVSRTYARHQPRFRRCPIWPHSCRAAGCVPLARRPASASGKREAARARTGASRSPRRNPSSDAGGPASLSSRVVQCTWPTQPRPPSVERHHTGRYVNAVAVLAP
jgi:hypothetical protein